MCNRLALALAIPFALSAGTAHAVTCNSLFALRVKQLGGLADCTNAALTESITDHCDVSQTANQCASDAYDDPASLTLIQSPGPMLGKWLPQCKNGTDQCISPELRCYDGTRPMVYAERAVVQSGYSNDWVIHMGGEGGPCHGDDCWAMYEGSMYGGAMGKAHQKAMSTYHPEFFTHSNNTGYGILSSQPVTVYGDNDFAGFNRIQFNRCSDGASDAYEELAVDGESVPVFHDGSAIWEGLVNSLTTVPGRDLGGGYDDYVNGPDLPPLNNDTRILLTAGSDATQWLIVNADWLRGLFESIVQGVVVRIAIDGYFAPMLQNEASYNDNPGTNVFTGPFNNPTGAQLPVGLDSSTTTYSDDTYQVGGIVRMDWEARGVALDSSCVGAHPIARKSCYDHLHVLLNHLSTPFFIASDQRDNTLGRLPPLWADSAYEWLIAEYRKRVVDQGHDVANLFDSLSEETATVTWSPGLFLPRPDSAKHVHFGDDAKSFGTRMRKCVGTTELETVSMAEALHRWFVDDTGIAAIEDPRIGAGLHWVTEPRTCGSPF